MRSKADVYATNLLSSSLWLRTYPQPKFTGVLAVTAIVVWGSLQFLQVALCSYALICMARWAESCITHLPSMVPAVGGPVLALCALSRAPRGTLTWTIHPDDPRLLCSIPKRPSPVLPICWQAGWCQRTQNPSNCRLPSVTISNSGAASLFLHLPGQLCMSME